MYTTNFVYAFEFGLGANITRLNDGLHSEFLGCDWTRGAAATVVRKHWLTHLPPLRTCLMLSITDVGIRGNEAHYVRLMHADIDLTSPLTKGRTHVRVTSYSSCPNGVCYIVYTRYSGNSKGLGQGKLSGNKDHVQRLSVPRQKQTVQIDACNVLTTLRIIM